MPKLVSIYTHKGWLVFVGPTHETEHWYPANASRFGCTLLHTDHNLGISRSALKVLSKLQRNNEDLGDISWFKSAYDGWVIGWIGTAVALKSIAEIESGEYVGDQEFEIPDPNHYSLIPNRVPQSIKKVIESRMEKE